MSQPDKLSIIIEAFQAIQRRADEIENVAKSVPEEWVAYNIRQRAETYRQAASDMLQAMKLGAGAAAKTP